VIASFRDAWLRDFYEEGGDARRVPADIERRLVRKLQMLDDATTDADLRVLPGNQFEKLRGNLTGWHSIRVNQRWRLIFRWNGSLGEAHEVYLDDHSYN